MYLLLEKGSAGWTESKGTVNDTTGALGRTVGQLYSQGKVKTNGTNSELDAPTTYHFFVLCV